MKKSIIYFLFCAFCISSLKGFSQSFVKTYTDLGINYVGLSVLPIDSSRTAVVGLYNADNSYLFYYNFTTIVDSTGKKDYTNTKYPQLYGNNGGSNLIKTPDGFAFYHYIVSLSMLGDYLYIIYTDDTLNSITNYSFENNLICSAGNINLYYVSNQGLFFTSSVNGMDANHNNFYTTFISKIDSTGNLVWNNSFGPNDSAYPCQLFNSIILSDSAVTVMGLIYDTLNLKKYDFSGNLLFDYKYSMFVYNSNLYCPPANGCYNLYGALIEVNNNILAFGDTIDASTNKYQLALEIVNLSGSAVNKRKFILNKDTANITPIAVSVESDTTAILNYTIAGSTLNYYLIIDYKGDSISSFTLPAFTVSTFDSGNILCALDSNNQIIVREFNTQETLVYKYVYKPFDSLNVCNAITPLPYPGRFVLTGSSDNNLLIIRQDTSVYNSINAIKQTEGISVYPNPANTLVTVEIAGNVGKQNTFDLYDMFGQKVQSEGLASRKTAINVGSLSGGVYFYRISSTVGKLWSSGKLVIVH